MKNQLYITHWCIIRENKVTTDDNVHDIQENFVNFAAFAKSIYKEKGLSYPKFHKMDNLSKLAFLAAEEIFGKSDVLQHNKPEEVGVVISNSVSSLDTDTEHQKTISDHENYFPSPAVFVYTLPNILIGEICIRHKIKGENAFLVSEKFNAEETVRYVSGLISEGNTKAVLCGWADIYGEKWDAALFLAELKETGENFPEFTSENLTMLYQHN
jgi:3-oxoacyl-(acyl-carrier-protein) synthase